MKWLLLLLCMGCVNGPTPKLVPLVPQEPTPIQWDSVMPHLLATADGVIVGTITKIESDWLYDDPCRLIAALLKRCDGTVTYRLHIENDLTDQWLWAFTPSTGTFGLFRGERAVFVWSKYFAWRFGECAQHSGLTAYCAGDWLPSLTEDLDVLPVADSARVAALFAERRHD